MISLQANLKHALIKPVTLEFSDFGARFMLWVTFHNTQEQYFLRTHFARQPASVFQKVDNVI